MKIHPTAIVDKKAELDKDVTVGPYAIIYENVRIGSGSKISSHAVVGSPSQDLKYKGENTFVSIGKDTDIREFVTINRATGEGERTIIGDKCLLMAYTHIAHNCIIGNGVVIANCGTLAGHVEIEDNAIIGGLVAIHQFCRIGELSLIGGCSKVTQDVPPYVIADGHPAKVYTINSVGLQRKGVEPEVRSSLKNALKIIYKSGLSTKSAVEKVQKEISVSQEISNLIGFITASKRGIC